MSKLIKKILHNRNPVELYLRVGFNLTAIIILFAMFLSARPATLFELQGHVVNMEGLLGVAIAVFLQTIAGACLVHLSLSRSEERKKS